MASQERIKLGSPDARRIVAMLAREYRSYTTQKQTGAIRGLRFGNGSNAYNAMLRSAIKRTLGVN